MNSRTLVKPKNKNSTIVPPIFSRKPLGKTFYRGTNLEAGNPADLHLGHYFGDVRVMSPSFKQTCPLGLSSPTYCPFGGACHTCPPKVQAKLKIGQPGDKNEREADRVAKQMNRMTDFQTYNGVVGSGQAQTATAPSIVHEVLSSPGRPLDNDTRIHMESRLGHDFSRVRVHTDAKAAESSKTINSLAYTFGQDVVFGAGQYNPRSIDGRKLLAHELAHVVQQREVADPLKREANHVAKQPGALDVGDRAPAWLQRQPPSDDPFSRQYGPPVKERPLPPRCSIIWKNGRWSLKCEGLPKIGSTPEIPLDPRDIPGRLKELIPKKEKGEEQTFPWPPESDLGLPPKWLEDLCKRNPLSPLCALSPKKKGPGGEPEDLAKPIGVFWTTDVYFEQDRPLAGKRSANGGLTADGRMAVNNVIFLLRLDPTLRVRLIGHASSEGSTAHNLELSKRRARFVFQKLEEADLDVRVMDPIKRDGMETGCEQLEFGVWACGESRSTQDEARPEERKVGVTFLRNPPLPGGPLKLIPPRFGRTE